MSKRLWAILGAVFVAMIYGATFTVAKDVMPTYVMPFGLILIRVLGATILFWIVSFFVKEEKIEKKDFITIAAAAFFGVAFNMLTFFKGLSYTSPISASVLMITAPIIVLILSAIILKEKIGIKKIVGVVIGLTGTCILILYGKTIDDSPKAGWGNFLVFLNAFSYGVYLVIIKKLISKYDALSFIKWIYTFGLLFVLPFGYQEFTEVNWTTIPSDIGLKITYLVLFTTFLAYMINLMAMKHLKPTTLSVFIYLQPLFATVFAIGLGKDELNPVKILSALLIFIGVFLVTQKRVKKSERISEH